MGRKVGQPYDNRVFSTRNEAVKYIVDNYSDKIPDDKYPEQIVYDYIHKDNKKRGICAIPTCKNKTRWNESTGKYRQICDDPKCVQSRRDNYLKNISKKYGTENLMADPTFNRDKLMNNRKVGTYYKWSDGSGSLRVLSMVEYRILEYLDTMLQYKFDDVSTQDPIIHYTEQDGSKHFHVPDIFIKSLNLIISAKDGMSNPNMSPHFRKDRLKNLVIYQTILNNTDYNYVQIEGDEEIPRLPSVTKEVAKMNMRGGRYIMPPRIDFFLLGETEYMEDVSVTFRNIVAFFSPHSRNVMCMFFVTDIIKDTLVYMYDDGVIKAMNAEKLYEDYHMDYLVLENPIDIVGMTAHSLGSDTIFKGDTTSLIRYMCNDTNSDFGKFYDELVTVDNVKLDMSHINTMRKDIVQSYQNKLSELFTKDGEHSIISSDSSKSEDFIEDNFESHRDIDGKLNIGLYSESLVSSIRDALDIHTGIVPDKVIKLSDYSPNMVRHIRGNIEQVIKRLRQKVETQRRYHHLSYITEILCDGNNDSELDNFMTVDRLMPVYDTDGTMYGDTYKTFAFWLPHVRFYDMVDVDIATFRKDINSIMKITGDICTSSKLPLYWKVINGFIAKDPKYNTTHTDELWLTVEFIPVEVNI